MLNRGEKKVGARKQNHTVRPEGKVAKRSFLRSLDGVLKDLRSKVSSLVQGSPLAMAKPIFEGLENRQMLSTSLGIGNYTFLYNNGVGTGYSTVLLGAGTTAGTTAVVTTAGAGIGSQTAVSTIAIALPAAQASYNVELALSNLPAAQQPNITFTGGATGVPVSLHIRDSAATYTFATTTVGFAAVVNDGAALSGATFVADGLAPSGPAANPFGADQVFAPAGSIGNITFAGSSVVTLGGGSMLIANTGPVGNVGLLTLPNVDVSAAGTANLVVDTRATGAATTNGGVTAGTVNLGGAAAHSASITTEANSTVGTAGAQVTVGAVVMGAGNFAGGLNITSPAGVSMGAVNTGAITTQGSVAAGVTIAPTGVANIGQVTLGAVAISGSNAGNSVAIGTGTTTFVSGVTTGAIVNTATAAADFSITGAAITGAINVTSYTLTNAVLLTPAVNPGSFIVNDGGALGGFTIGAITLGDNDGLNDTGAFTVTVVGTTGAVSTGSIINSSVNDVSFVLDSNNSGDATASVSLAAGGTVTIHKAGDVTLNTGANAGSNITGALTVGNILLDAVTAGNFLLTTGGNVGGATVIGNVTAQGTGAQIGNAAFSIGGTATTVNIGNIAMGDALQADTSDFSFKTGQFTVGGGMGALVVGTIATDGNSGATVTIDTSAAGAIGGVTLGAVTIAGTGTNSVAIGHNAFGGLAAAANLGILNLGAVAISGIGSLSLLGQQAGAVNITGLWSFSNATAGAGGAGGSVTIEAFDRSTPATDATRNGAFGDIGGAGWNIDYFGLTGGIGTVGGINFTSADGAGNVLINSVDHFSPTVGFMRIIVNADAATELGTVAANARVGSIGNFTISNPGDNSVGVLTAGAWNNVEFGFTSYVVALSGGNINIAGGAQGTFVASILPAAFVAAAPNGVVVANTGGAGTWGTVTTAGQSDTLWVIADDGIGAINVNSPPTAAQNTAAVIGVGGATLVSIANNIIINANADNGSEVGAANNIGTVTSLHVVGSPGMTSLSGNVSGVAVGNVVLDAGDLSLNITAGPTAASAADRQALNATGLSSIANVSANLGSIIGGSYISDSNIGNIAASNPGNITLATVQSDAIATSPIAIAVNGTIGTIAAGGTLSITLLKTRHAADTTYRATQSVGAITARNGIAIASSVIGGDMPSVTVTRVGTAGTGGVNLGVAGLDINGSVNTITAGLLPADAIVAGGIIRGDLNLINAGPATVTSALAVLAATRSSATAPIFVITQGNGVSATSGVDYVVSLTGTWVAGTTPVLSPSASLGVSFNGVGTAGINNLTVNNFNGVTSATDTIFTLATRTNATGGVFNYAGSGLGLKNTAVLFSLGGFQSTYNGPGTDKGRNSFKQFLIEGNLLGAMGGPGLMLPTTNAAAMLASNAPLMGHIVNLEIGGQWFNLNSDTVVNAANRIFVTQIDEISVGSVSFNSVTGVPASFSYIAPNAAYPTVGTPNAVAAKTVLVPNNFVVGDAGWHDLEVFTALAAPSGTQVVVVPIGSGIVKKFVGPTGAFETIELSNDDLTDGVVNTAILTLTGGVISQLNLFGQSIDVLFNTVDPAIPATNSTTRIIYGQSFTDPNTSTVYTATTFQPGDPTGVGPHAAPNRQNVIDLLYFSSAIGDVTVIDTVPADGVPTNLGDVVVGYGIDIATLPTIPVPGNMVSIPHTPAFLAAIPGATVATYLNNPNTSGTDQTIRFTGGATPVPVYAGVGNINVNGAVGLVATSGSVLSVTTTQPGLVVGAVPTSNFYGLVTDGSSGAINIQGSVTASLVVGDRTVIAAGPTAATPLVGAIVGINGTPSFTAPIVAAVDIGSTAGNVLATNRAFILTGPQAGRPYQQPTTITGDQISAPDNISVDITAGNILNSAVVSGKRILVTITENQDLAGVAGDPIDDIDANITAIDILGDIWSGNKIGSVPGAKSIRATGLSVAGIVDQTRGNITSSANNPSLDIWATGGSAGDINTNIFAAGNMVNINIIAGSASAVIAGVFTPPSITYPVTALTSFGTGGSLQANVIAGTDGVGGVLSTFLTTGLGSNISADQNIGLANNTNVISAADTMTWNNVLAGLQNNVDPLAVPADPIDGGTIYSDFVDGVPLGQLVPVGTPAFGPNPASTLLSGINDANMPIFQNQNDSIFIVTLNAGNVAYVGDTDTNPMNEQNSNLWATLEAAGSITVQTTNIDGNAVGNNGIPGGHIAAAGMGFFTASPGAFAAGSGNHAILTFASVAGNITDDLTGTFSAGMFMPFNNSGSNPLQVNDVPVSQVPGGATVYQAGTVLTLGEVQIGFAGLGAPSPAPAVTLNVGRWIQNATGVNAQNGTDQDGINLNELLAGTESGANKAFAPTFSIGATHNIFANILAVGRPFIPAVATNQQGGPGSTAPNPADGDGSDISIAAFGGVDGTVAFEDSAKVNFVMSNIDAITAIDTGAGNPTSPSTNLAFNNAGSPTLGTIGTDNSLDILAFGNDTGGLNVEFYTAGLDYFTRINTGSAAPTASNAPTLSQSTVPSTPDFFASWGVGNINNAVLFAGDADPTNGLEAGKLDFALIAAGNDVTNTVQILATDDIIAYKSSNVTDGTALLPGGNDADLIAGLDVNNSIAPSAEATLFRGGEMSAQVVAGDDIYKGHFVGGPPTSTTTTTTGIQTFSVPYTIQQTPPLAPPVTSVAVVLPQFNPASVPGVVTLDSAVFTGTMTFTGGTGQVTNTGAVPVNATFAINRNGTLTSPNINLALAAATFTQPFVGLAPGTGEQDFTATTQGPISASQTLVAPAALAAVTGAGSVTYTAAGFQSFSQTGASDGLFNSGFIELPNFAGDLAVVYHYTVSTTVITPGPGTQLVRDPANPLVSIVAQGRNYIPGSPTDPQARPTDLLSGAIDPAFVLISGAVDQLNGADLLNTGIDNDNGLPAPQDSENGNIEAQIIASNEVSGLIDAGDTHNVGSLLLGAQQAGIPVASGLPGSPDTASATTGDFFRGGVWAGAGPDLNMYTAADNAVNADIHAVIRTGGDLNVEDFSSPTFNIPLGILAEAGIPGNIQVGWSLSGGNLLGNVIAENNINEIQVFGNVGRANHTSVIYTDGIIQNFGIGNAKTIPGGGFAVMHPSVIYTGGQGNLFADVYEGAQSTSAVAISIGGTVQPTATIAVGSTAGVTDFVLEQNGAVADYSFSFTYAFAADGDPLVALGGRGAFFVTGGNVGDNANPAAPGMGGVDIVAVGTPITNPGDQPALPAGAFPAFGIELTVTGNGRAAGIHKLIAGDTLDHLHVVDGSVGQIIVNDDLDITSIIGGVSGTGYLGRLSTTLNTFPFITNSIPVNTPIEQSFNNDKLPINANVINVDFNIGSTTNDLAIGGQTIGAGMNVAMDNVAVSIQGTLLGNITSENGSIGNILVNALAQTGAPVSANSTVAGASIFAFNSIGDIYVVTGGVSSANQFKAQTGSMGVLSVQLDINNPIIAVQNDLGGLISRIGVVDMTATQNGHTGIWVDGSIGLVQASGYVAGTFLAETGSIGLGVSTLALDTTAGIYSHSGNLGIEAGALNLTAGTDIGNLLAKLGNIDNASLLAGRNVGNLTASTGSIGVDEDGDGDDVVIVTVGQSIGQVNASGDVNGTYVAQTGTISGFFSDAGNILVLANAGVNIGPVHAGQAVNGTYLAGGNIGDVTARTDIGTGITSTTFTAGANIGLLQALTGTIGNINAHAGANIDGVIASVGILGNYIAEAGTIGSVNSGIAFKSSTLDVNVTANAGDSILNVAAPVGAILGTYHAHNNLGNITASLDITGTYVAETGNIGDITSNVGDIGISAIAGADIGNVQAMTGSIMGNYDEAIIVADGVNITIVNSAVGGINGSGNGDSSGAGNDSGNGGTINAVVSNFTGTGTVHLKLENVTGLIRAGGQIGNISAFKDIGFYNIEAGTDIGSVTTTVGRVGAPVDVDVTFLPIGLGNDVTDFYLGQLNVVAGNSIGAVTSGLDIGSPVTSNVVNGITVVADGAPVNLNAISGSIANIESLGGSITNLKAVASVSMGDITASENLTGTYIVQSGPLGNVKALTGDIGTLTTPVVIKANGGVGIDPVTLKFVARPNTGRTGVGNIFAYLGDINLDLRTGGDVGVMNTTNLQGGIAAPLGTINASLKIGGDFGGLNAATPGHVDAQILGRSGIVIGLAGGTAHLSGGNSVVIPVGGITYTLTAANADGTVDYTVNNGQVIFNKIELVSTPGLGAGVTLTTSATGSVDPATSSAQAKVLELDVHGSLANIRVDGDIAALNVDGDLVGDGASTGTVFIEGRLEAGKVSHDIGRNDPTTPKVNAFIADGIDIKIGKGFGSLIAGARNFGLAAVSVGNGSYVSWANTLRTATGQGDGFLNVYLGTGTGVVTVNNGQIDKIALNGTTAANLVVVTTPQPLEALTKSADAKATAKGVSHQTDALLAAQVSLVANNQISTVQKVDGKNTKLNNLVFQGPLDPGSNALSFTTAPGRSSSAYVGSINLTANKGTLSNVIVKGSAGRIALGNGGTVNNVVTAVNLGTLSAAQIKGVDVRGNAGTISGVSVSNVKIAGNVDVVGGTALVSSLNVGGNAGSVTSGTLISNAFIGGSAIQVSAPTLTAVQVIGSVGLETTGAPAGGLTLGKAFNAVDAARILGTTPEGLASSGDAGPNGTRYVGGITASKKATGVSVGGQISELAFASSTGNDLASLIGKVADDALIGTSSKPIIQKVDGVIVKFSTTAIKA